MKSLLLLFVIGLAVAEHNIDQAFRARREYSYRYETQIATGNEPSSKIFTGYKMSCIARVQFITYSVVRVSFEHIELFTFDRPILQYEPAKHVNPNTNIEELVGPEMAVIEKFLRLPFGFTYDDGRVVKIQLQDEETHWSANSKRGFVSLFQMNLEKRLLLESLPGPKVPDYNDLYTVLEKSPEGECATVYNVEKKKSTNEVYVHKTRDFERCIDRPVSLNTELLRQFVPDMTKQSPLTIQTNLQYNLRTLGRKKFIIDSVVAQEIITFAPYTQKLAKAEQGEFRTVVNQTLNLWETRLISKSSEIEEFQESRHWSHDLRMTVQTKQANREDPFGLIHEDPQQENNKFDVYSWDKIYHVLRVISENNLELTTEDAMVHLRLASDMMSTSPKSVLHTIWNKLSNTRSTKDPIDLVAAKVFWDMLSSVGTEPAAELVLDVCSKDRSMEQNCTMALHNLVLKAPSTPRLIRKLVDLISHKRRSMTESMKQTCYLTLGSFGYKLMQEKEKQLKHIQKVEDLLKPLKKSNSRVMRELVLKRIENVRNQRKTVINKCNQIDDLIVNTLKKLVETGNTKDQILGLKSLANSGLSLSTRVLKKILNNRNEPVMVRLMAMLGFRRFNVEEHARQEAIETAFNIFMDKKETHEMRNMAFLVLLKQKPTEIIYQKIAVKMNHEKDMDVASFVLGYMETMANTTVEPLYRLSKNFTWALKSAPGYKEDYIHSFFKYWGKYFPEYKLGNAFRLTGIRSPSRYMGFSLNYDTMVFGRHNSYLEVGINSVGLQNVINKLFGPRGILTKNKSVLDILKRRQRDLSPQDIIQRIFHELKIKSRDIELPSGHIYIKMMGHELAYYDFTTLSRTFLTSGKYPVSVDFEKLAEGHPFSLQRAGLCGNHKLTLPTTAGFPVSLMLQLTYNINTQGKFGLQVKPFVYEEQRQGRPPVTVDLDLEMTPKMTFGLYGAMGLDAFFVKNTHGFYVLAKTEAPIKEKVSYDSAHNKFFWEHEMPKSERPLFEFKSEPVSERVVITTTKDTPIMLYNRRPVYTPNGVRVQPLYIPYDLKCIGWRSEITGQLPNSWYDLYMPLQGRTVINFYLKPQEKAATRLTFRGQYILDNKQEALSYARSYQETMTKEREQYGRDVEQMDRDGIQFDRFGRPKPTNINDILPPSEPLDLSHHSVNMVQLVKKLEKKIGQPIPMVSRQYLNGFVMTLDASENDVQRQFEVFGLFAKLWSGAIRKGYVHFYRSPIHDYDNEKFEFVSKIDFKYPQQVMKPVDIFSVEWQKQILKEIQYHLGFESSQVMNSIMNQTLLTVIQQNNFENMKKVPAYRVLEALIPQHMSKVMNISALTVYPKNWNSYWRDLIPMHHKWVEEDKLNMDPYFMSREGLLLNQMKEFLLIQARLKTDLYEVINSHKVNHAEIPIIQWLLLKQSEVCGFFHSVLYKDAQKGRIQHFDVLQRMVRVCTENDKQLNAQMDRVLREVNALTREIDQNGQPIVLTRAAFDRIRDIPEIAITRDYRRQDRLSRQDEDIDSESYDYPPSDYIRNDDDEELLEDDTLDYEQQSQQDLRQQPLSKAQRKYLRVTLYKLIILQSEVITEITDKTLSKQRLDMDIIQQLVKSTTKNMTLVDSILKDSPIYDDVIIEQLMMVTVQNERVVRLMNQHKRTVRQLQLDIKESSEKDQRTQALDKLCFKLMGLQIASRTSYLYWAKQGKLVITPVLKKQERTFWRQIQHIKRNIFVDQMTWDMQIAVNVTALRDPKVADPLFRQLIEDCNDYQQKLETIIEQMFQINRFPSLWLVSELLETVTSVKSLVEHAQLSTLPITYHQRFTWIERLGQQATKAQSLIGKMYVLYTKYTTQNRQTRPIPVLDNIPMDVHMMEVQDVISQLRDMKKQIVQFVQTQDVPIESQQKIIEAVVDRCGLLQEMIKEAKLHVLTALEQYGDYERSVIASVFTKALNKHRQVVELVRSVLTEKYSYLQHGTELSQKVADLEVEITTVENELNDKLFDVKDLQKQQQDRLYNDEYRSQEQDRTFNDEFRQAIDEEDDETYGYTDELTDYSPSQKSELPKRLQDLAPMRRLPTGIVGLINTTWGSGEVRDKKAIIQIMAVRSVEQAFRLWRELNPIFRSEEMVKAVNKEMQGNVFEKKVQHAMDSLNTFNHLHTIFRFNKDDIPMWIQKQLWVLQDRVKRQFWDNYYVDEPVEFTQGEQKEIHTVQDLSDFNKKFDMWLMTPTETNKFLDVPMNTFYKAFVPNKGHVSYTRQVERYLYNEFEPPRCFVNMNQMQTFDNVGYTLPKEDAQCEHLLAMDCSQQSAFAITMQKSNSSLMGHTLRIVNDDKDILVKPNYMDVEVQVDGQVQVLTDGKPIEFKKQLAYELYEPTVVVLRQGTKVTIDLKLTGVTIIIKGPTLQILVSSVYKKRMCGLCSNYDQQASWEWEGPLREVYTSPEAFARSYVLPSQSCNDRKAGAAPHELPHLHPIPPPLHPDYSQGSQIYRDVMAPFRPKGSEPSYDDLKDDSQKDSQEDPDRCQPEQVHDVKMRRGKSQICITKKPVPKCPFDCSEKKESKKQRVEYVCVDSRRPEVQDLKNELSHGSINWDNYPQIQKKKTIRRNFRSASKCQPEDL